jgi:hypothetical protein
MGARRSHYGKVVHVTEGAIAWLMEIDFPVDRVLRLEAMSGGGLVLTFGDPAAGDLVIERAGQDLLHVSRAVAATLADAELDRIDTPDGPRVAIFCDDFEADANPEIYEDRE